MEPQNFADDIVRGSNCRKRTVLKNWADALFIILTWINADGLSPLFLLVVPGIAAVQDVFKVFFEIELGVKGNV